jgi:hypothetical protein
MRASTAWDMWDEILLEGSELGSTFCLPEPPTDRSTNQPTNQRLPSLTILSWGRTATWHYQDSTV